MKKVLYFVLFVITAVLCGCNKDDEDVYEAEPSYKSWNRSNFIYDSDLEGIKHNIKDHHMVTKKHRLTMVLYF